MAREQEGFIKHEGKEIGFYLFWGIFVTILLPLFLGFVRGGFEDSFIAGQPLLFGDILTTYLIYYIIITAGLIGLTTLKILELIYTKPGDDITAKGPIPVLTTAYMHDPEKDGALYRMFKALGFSGKKNWMRWSVSMFRLFIYFTIIFGALGLVQTVNPSAQFVGIPQLPFQVTETIEVLFTAEPPAFAETTLMIFVLSILMGINRWFVNIFNFESSTRKGAFWFIALVIIAPLIGLLWMGWHNIVYGASDVALLATFIFGWLGATLTILMGSWIPWYVWHFWNNIFAKLREVVPADTNIVAWIVAGLIILSIGMFIGEVAWHRFKKNRVPLPREPS